MRRRRIGIVAAVATVVAAASLVAFARFQALALITHPLHERRPVSRTPADVGLPYADVQVTTADGLELQGWRIPSRNGATILLQHGYKVDRGGRILDIAAVLHGQGYGVLLTTVRAHDRSDGRLITFGHHEMQDLQAWYDWASRAPETRGDVLGAFGNSMGGSLLIQFAARTERIRAVVAHSAFSSLLDTVDTSVRSFTGLPPFPFAPLMRFWIEREWGFSAATIDFTRWIDDISPRPVLLMQGGADRRISPGSGQRLFDAAGEPRELWFEPELEHADFQSRRPDEFRRRVTAFFDRHLLATSAAAAP